MNIKTFPKRLDSKTNCLRITVPENLDLALEGLIRKVLKEQPKTEDIYSFAAAYFETLLKIRDTAGTKFSASQLCPFHNDEDANEMIKLAGTFSKPVKNNAALVQSKPVTPGKKTQAGKTQANKYTRRSKVTKDKRGVEKNKQETPDLIKKLPNSMKIRNGKTEKEEVEDEEFLASDPIKQLVENELMMEAKLTERKTVQERKVQEGKGGLGGSTAILKSAEEALEDENHELNKKPEEGVDDTSAEIKEEVNKEANKSRDSGVRAKEKQSENETENLNETEKRNMTKQEVREQIDEKEKIVEIEKKGNVLTELKEELSHAGNDIEKKQLEPKDEETKELSKEEAKSIAQKPTGLDPEKLNQNEQNSKETESEKQDTSDKESNLHNSTGLDINEQTKPKEMEKKELQSKEEETKEVKESEENLKEIESKEHPNYITSKEIKSNELNLTESKEFDIEKSESQETELKEQPPTEMEIKERELQERGTKETESKEKDLKESETKEIKFEEAEKEKESEKQKIKESDIEKLNANGNELNKAESREINSKEVDNTGNDGYSKILHQSERIKDQNNEAMKIQDEFINVQSTIDTKLKEDEKDKISSSETLPVTEPERRNTTEIRGDTQPSGDSEIKTIHLNPEESITTDDTGEPKNNNLTAGQSETTKVPEEEQNILKELLVTEGNFAEVKEEHKPKEESKDAKQEHKATPKTGTKNKLQLEEPKKLELQQGDQNKSEAQALDQVTPTKSLQEGRTVKQENKRKGEKDTEETDNDAASIRLTSEAEKHETESFAEELCRVVDIEHIPHKQPELQAEAKEEEGEFCSVLDMERIQKPESNQNEQPDEELCTVVDTQHIPMTDKTDENEHLEESTSAQSPAVEIPKIITEEAPGSLPPGEIQIKTIQTHYYNTLQVPETLTKKYTVHSVEIPPLTSLLGTSASTVDENGKRLGATEEGFTTPEKDKCQQELDSDNQKSESDHLPDMATPTSGYSLNLSELSWQTVSGMFLDSEKRFSSLEKEEMKYVIPKPNEETRQEVEEVIEKTIVPSRVGAVPVPPRDAEVINEENLQITESPKKQIGSMESSCESSNGQSFESDIPIMSVKVKTIVETQILDDDDDDGDGESGEVEVQVVATVNILEPESGREIQNATEESSKIINSTEKEKESAIEKINESDSSEKSKTELTEKETSDLENRSGNHPEEGDTKQKSCSSEQTTGKESCSLESDSTMSSAATEIKTSDFHRRNSNSNRLPSTQSLDLGKRSPLLKTRSLSTFRHGVTDFEVWNTIEKELEEAATKIQSKFRGYKTRKKLQRLNAVQITTEESSASTTPVEAEVKQNTGEFHDSIVLSEHPR